jgi:tagatose-1,6-bisphosphate aldolase
MSLEESGYNADKSEVPKLLPDWGIKGVQEHQSAAKFLLYFHPNEARAQEKIDLVQTLFAQAQDEQVPFLLEIVLYPIEDKTEFEAIWHVLQLEVIKRFSTLCDVLKIEYPGLHAESDDHARAMCQAVSQAATVPWIILSRGMQYDRFMNSLQISMETGASGFAVGRAVWQEIEQFALEKTGSWQATLDGLKHFLELTAVSRFEALVKVVEK